MEKRECSTQTERQDLGEANPGGANQDNQGGGKKKPTNTGNVKHKDTTFKIKQEVN